MPPLLQLVQILRNYNYPTQVLVASIRTATHLLRAAEMGAHVATLPFAVMKQNPAPSAD